MILISYHFYNKLIKTFNIGSLSVGAIQNNDKEI